MKARMLVIILSAVGVSSCASTVDVRPEDATLTQAAIGVHSGKFDRRLERKKLVLGGSQVGLSNEQKNNKVQQATLARKQQEFHQLNLKLSSIKKENKALEKKISQQKAQTAKEKKKRAQALAKIKSIKVNIAQAEVSKPKSSSGSSTKYQKRINELQKEVELLREMAAG